MSLHPGHRWKPPRAVSDQGKMPEWGILEQLECSSHPSRRFLVIPEMGTGVGADHFNEPYGINYSRFWSLCIRLVTIYSLGLEWARCWFLLAVSTALSGAIPHICSERQFGGLKYRDYTMSIKGKLRKTDPRCLRATYTWKQRNLKPHKKTKLESSRTRNNHPKVYFTFL